MAVTSDFRGQRPRSRARTSDKTPGNSSFLFVFGWFRVVMVVWARLVGAMLTSSRRSSSCRMVAGMGFSSERCSTPTQMLAIVATMSVLVSTLIATPMSASAAEPTLPAAPTGLVSVPSWNRVELTWDDSGDPSITGFQVLRGSDAESLVVIESDAAGAYTLPYTDWEVAPVTTYVYAVQAVNDLGVGAQSITVEVVTPKEPTLVLFPERLPRGDVPAVPAAPTGLVSVPSWNRVELTWDDSGDPSITGFQVLRGSDAESLVVIESDAAGAYTLPYTDWEVAPVTTYVYAVQAVNDLGVGAQSITVEVFTPKEPTLVLFPERLPRGDVPAVPAGRPSNPSPRPSESPSPSGSGNGEGVVEPQPPADGFSDLADAGVHEDAIRELDRDGVLVGSGCGDGRLCPTEVLPRREMAVWLVRIIDGEEPAPTTTSRFEDVDADLWWAAHVERLAELGITIGCSVDGLLFCPDELVKRSQMANFLTRAFQLEVGGLTAGFEDVSVRSNDAPNINAVFAAGVTLGCSTDPLLFCPSEPVKRSQMASFLVRARVYRNPQIGARETS